MSGDGPPGVAEAWTSFCRRLEVLGERVVGEARSPEVAAEGVHHLANQVACWLTYAIGHADPVHPSFFRSSDPVYQWGGPNADQVARRAAIDGAGTYRVSGRMGTCEEFVLQVKSGRAQSGGATVTAEVHASSLGIGRGDAFELLLAATPRPGNWIPLDADAAFVHVRDYYFDWRPGEPATFVIERLDLPPTPRPARTAGRVAALLDDAAAEIEHAVAFWSGYQDRMLEGRAVNTFGDPAGAARGVQEILYSHALVALGPDEALVVELDPGGAPLWDVQLYNRPWYEALDFANRVTSTNHRLAVTDDDGVVRIVVAGRDPGSANWLDTEGRDEVLATIRLWRPSGRPEVASHLRPLDAAGPRRTGDDERLAQLRRRVEHVAWRYRT